jgi:hypothetical protein
MDNNVFASNCYDKIIDEIRDCGFGRGATYTPPNEYDVAIENLRAPEKEHRNVRGYISKILKLYDQITLRLPVDEQGTFCLRREELRLYYPGLATKEAILEFDNIAKPLYDKFFKRYPRVRYIDFNQGVDARLVTPEKMAKMAEVNIRPLRIAFDHYEMKGVYIKAIETAAAHGIKDLSNYLLYNFKDKPEHLYERMRINVDLCERLGVTIYSFPMKYHPIDDPKYFDNRDYIGINWNRKFIRAIQAVLNATKGKIGRGLSFFEEAFGRDLEEFNKILWMPEAFIIYRRKYDADLRERLQKRYDLHVEDESNLANEWWIKFQNLSAEQSEIVKSIVAKNRFEDSDITTTDATALDVLEYYKIKR